MSDAPKSRCLGLVGGLGVGATIHYYRELVKAHQARGCVPQLLIAHADLRRVLEYIQTGDLLTLAQYLGELIDRLRASGAQVAAISAVTPHACAVHLAAISPLPLVNLLDFVAEEIRAKGLQRVALFGTRFTIETGLFGQLGTLESVLPTPNEVEFIHDIYLQVAHAGTGSDEQRKGLAAIARVLCERDRAEAIVLAGTELSLLFNESNTDFPNVDCSRIHINAIMRCLVENAADIALETIAQQ